MYHFIYNGKLASPATPVISPDNRSFRYGDGLFETLKYQGGQIQLLDEHFARLWMGLQLFQYDIPKLFTPDLLQNQVLELLKKNGHHPARIRITVSRGDGGLYDNTNQLSYLIQTWPLSPSASQWNENGLQAGIYRQAKKMADDYSGCKHNNYLPYFMAALHAKKNKWNDAIVLNQFERICDSTIANIFIVKDSQVYTPSLQEGCIAGIMRKFLLQQLPLLPEPIMVKETSISETMLKEADEVFLTNSVFNIRWIQQIDDIKFGNTFTRKLYGQLLFNYPNLFN